MCTAMYKSSRSQQARHKKHSPQSRVPKPMCHVQSAVPSMTRIAYTACCSLQTGTSISDQHLEGTKARMRATEHPSGRPGHACKQPTPKYMHGRDETQNLSSPAPQATSHACRAGESQRAALMQELREITPLRPLHGSSLCASSGVQQNICRARQALLRARLHALFPCMQHTSSSQVVHADAGGQAPRLAAAARLIELQLTHVQVCSAVQGEERTAGHTCAENCVSRKGTRATACCNHL